jgi:SAM-dependent methyltransferase
VELDRRHAAEGDRPVSGAAWYADATFAAEYSQPDIAAAYQYRYPYPAEAFEVMLSLVQPGPRTVLDLGTGQGELARGLVTAVERVDAVDISAEMINRGRQLPGGADARLNWIIGSAEETGLRGPYALVTCGTSLHWMDWPRLFPRLRQLMNADARLAIVDRRRLDHPWSRDLSAVIDRHQVHRGIGGRRFAQAVTHVAEDVERAGFFVRDGAATTSPVPFRQSLTEFIEALHSRNGLGRDTLGPAAAARFDAEVIELVRAHQPDDEVESLIYATVVWGHPSATEE